MNIKINRGLFAYVSLCLLLLLNDYIEYITKIDYRASLVFSGIILLAVWKKFIKKHVDIYKIKISKFDVFAIGILILLFVLKMTIPDFSWDTLNYHIYFQQFLGRDFVNHDFFPNRVMNEVSLYFADRMFYFFRYFLGYRMGTVLNTIVAILFFTQLTDFIRKIFADMTLDFKVKDYAVALIALSGVLIENIVLDFNIYYVDLLALPLILECLRIVIFDEDNSIYKMCFLAFIAGVSVSLKMSNTFFLIPLAFIYIIKFRKSITLKSIVFSVLAALFTVALYLVLSFKLTGNPLFPYLNSLFKSPYFATDVSPNTLSDFYDWFGPKNVLQYIFWPIYIIIRPELCANSGFYIGYILQCFIIIFIAFFSKKKYGKKILYVDIIWIVFYLFYLIAINGYNRYSIIVDSLSAVIIGIYCYVWIREKKSKLIKFVSVVMILSIAVSVGIVVRNTYIYNINRAGSKSILTDSDIYKKNAKLLFKDYENGVDKKIINDVDYWYIIENNSGYASLIKPVPMVTSFYGITNETTQKIYDKYLENMKNKNVYTISNKADIRNVIEKIRNGNFKIKDIYTSNCNYSDKPLTFFKLEYNEDLDKGERVYTLKDTADYDIDLDDYKRTGYKSEFFIGRYIAASGMGNSGFIVNAELISDKGCKELFNAKWLPGSSYVKENVNIPENEIGRDAKIRFTIYNSNNFDEQSFKPYWVNIIEQRSND